MADLETQPRRIAASNPGFAYLMTGIAIGCIWLSYVLCAVFGPDLVTGAQHQHFKSAASYRLDLQRYCNGLGGDGSVAGDSRQSDR